MIKNENLYQTLFYVNLDLKKIFVKLLILISWSTKIFFWETDKHFAFSEHELCGIM